MLVACFLFEGDVMILNSLFINKLILVFLLMCFSFSIYAAGGVVVGSTRVVFDGSKKEANLSLKNNNDKSTYLIQSWVEDASGNNKTPFIITPPLFKLDPVKENMLRIVRAGGNLPEDRESVYYVNVKAIPPAPAEESANTLQLAIKTRMKLFYRPAGLKGSPMDSYKALVWKKEGDSLRIVNNTPFSVTLSEVKVNGSEIDKVDLVLPMSSTSYKLPSKVNIGAQVVFTTINDYGGTSELQKAILQ